MSKPRMGLDIRGAALRSGTRTVMTEPSGPLPRKCLFVYFRSGMVTEPFTRLKAIPRDGVTARDAPDTSFRVNVRLFAEKCEFIAKLSRFARSRRHFPNGRPQSVPYSHKSRNSVFFFQSKSSLFMCTPIRTVQLCIINEDNHGLPGNGRALKK
jgi:hypothetical protein